MSCSTAVFRAMGDRSQPPFVEDEEMLMAVSRQRSDDNSQSEAVVSSTESAAETTETRPDTKPAGDCLSEDLSALEVDGTVHTVICMVNHASRSQ